jgi:hypothetical protein
VFLQKHTHTHTGADAWVGCLFAFRKLKY